MVGCLDQTVVVGHALAFVVSLFGDGTGGTALNTGGAAVFRHTVCIVLGVGALGRLQGENDNDGALTASFSLSGDQSVTQAEGAEA